MRVESFSRVCQVPRVQKFGLTSVGSRADPGVRARGGNSTPGKPLLAARPRTTPAERPGKGRSSNPGVETRKTGGACDRSKFSVGMIPTGATVLLRKFQFKFSTEELRIVLKCLGFHAARGSDRTF